MFKPNYKEFECVMSVHLNCDDISAKINIIEIWTRCMDKMFTGPVTYLVKTSTHMGFFFLIKL